MGVILLLGCGVAYIIYKIYRATRRPCRELTKQDIYNISEELRYAKTKSQINRIYDKYRK